MAQVDELPSRRAAAMSTKSIGFSPIADELTDETLASNRPSPYHTTRKCIFENPDPRTVNPDLTQSNERVAIV